VVPPYAHESNTRQVSQQHVLSLQQHLHINISQQELLRGLQQHLFIKKTVRYQLAAENLYMISKSKKWYARATIDVRKRQLQFYSYKIHEHALGLPQHLQQHLFVNETVLENLFILRL
jgi:hypothetical protein